MIALFLFTGIASVLVWWAGRKDAALDPRLTTVVLGLVAVFPLLVQMLPEIAVVPWKGGGPGGFPWGLVIGAVWLGGFVISSAGLLKAALMIGRWRRSSRLLERVGVVELRLLDELNGPVAAGVFRKLVFVPPAWQEWDEGRRKLVLDHEFAHHRRRDPLRRWIAGLAVAVNWFNPLVRWMVGRLMLQCEFACDEQVLSKGVKQETYAGLLCDLAGESRHRGMVLGMAERSGLERRVRRMMDDRNDGEGPATAWLILFAVASAGLLAILGAERIAGYTKGEIGMRRTADPFPGNAP